MGVNVLMAFLFQKGKVGVKAEVSALNRMLRRLVKPELISSEMTVPSLALDSSAANLGLERSLPLCSYSELSFSGVLSHLKTSLNSSSPPSTSPSSYSHNITSQRVFLFW